MPSSINDYREKIGHHVRALIAILGDCEEEKEVISTLHYMIWSTLDSEEKKLLFLHKLACDHFSRRNRFGEDPPKVEIPILDERGSEVGYLSTAAARQEPFHLTIREAYKLYKSTDQEVYMTFDQFALFWRFVAEIEEVKQEWIDEWKKGEGKISSEAIGQWFRPLGAIA